MFAQITLPAIPMLAYLVLCGIAAADLFLPVLPSGATMITAGVIAAGGHLSPIPVFASGLIGAWAGDLAGFRLGKGLGHLHHTGHHAAHRRTWWTPRPDHDRVGRWERRFTRHGVLVLVLARYLPAGRTAAALGAGRIGVDGRRFLLCALAAETLWAGPAMLIGYAGGHLLPDGVVKVALGVMAAFTLAALLVVGVRRFRRPAGAAPADSAGRSTTSGS